MPLNLLRLRLARRPPVEAVWGQSFCVALSLTDDLGYPFFSYTKLPVKFDLLDAQSGQVIENINISVTEGKKVTDNSESDNVGHLVVERGDVQAFVFKAIPNPNSKIQAQTTKVRLRVRIINNNDIPGFGRGNKRQRLQPNKINLSQHELQMLDFIGEKDQTCIFKLSSTQGLLEQPNHDNDTSNNDYIACLKCVTQEFSFLKSGSTKENVKVQEAIFDLYPKPYSSLRIMEEYQKGLASHIWDSALVLGLYLLNNQDSLIPNVRDPTSNGNEVININVLELGCGCGLNGMISAQILSASSLFSDSSSILCTDLQDVVQYRTIKNLELNQRFIKHKHCKAIPLDWEDKDLTSQVQFETNNNQSPSSPNKLIILAADVLYNTSSHEPFLDTILALFKSFTRPNSPSPFALIAYKPRMEGDDAFFDMARSNNLKVEKVWKWNLVTIFRISLQTI